MLKHRRDRRLMAATLGLACFLVGATSQANIMVSGITVSCIEKNEVGEDEIFLRFAVGTAWHDFHMGNFSSGTSTPTSDTWVFTGTLPQNPLYHELWESDGAHWYDGDDRWEREFRTVFGPWSEHSVDVGAQTHDYWYFFTLTSV